MFQRVGCYCTGGCLPSNPLSVVLLLPSPSSFCVARAAFFFYSIVPLSLKLYLNQNFMSEYAVKSSYFYVLRLYSDSLSSTMRGLILFILCRISKRASFPLVPAEVTNLRMSLIWSCVVFKAFTAS